MTRQNVVLLGSLPFEMSTLSRLVQDAGWTLDVAAGIDQLRDRRVSRRPAAILVAASGLNLSWPEALQAAREIDSEALLIACHRFSDRVSWAELAEAGAFHSLALPLDPNEVRQSLAFVWSHWLRRTERNDPRSRHLPFAWRAAGYFEAAGT